MYPPSSDAEADLWDRNTDGARLIANALLVAANHFPTVDALADQSVEATSAAPVSFTLDATASDLDGDTLSYSWSGAVTASGPSLVVDVPLPPAPQKSHTVTLELTVADGKGGVATDSVDLTVSDTTAPQLQGVPGDMTVEATSASGATVPYGPVTATDLVDGTVAAVCSHSGEFPVGDTLVTCSASDSRQNEASASFTVSVTPAPEPEPEPGDGRPGRGYARGFVNANHRHYELSLFASENSAGGERGRLVLTVKSGYRTSNGYRRRTEHFISTDVTSVTFGADCSVVIAGTGRWNGSDGYRFEAAAADTHNRRRSHDVVRVTITSPGGEVVAHVDGRLTGGNVHIFHKGY
jgi:hypothetical protein